MIQVYSTLTRRKHKLHKEPGERLTLYVCGPTVYKPSHIGHMVGPVIFDTVKRYLAFRGYTVHWVVNITDVDDKLIKRAGELGTTVPELAADMTADYFECLKKLNVTGIDEFPRATDHIPGMVAMMERLIAKGHAYAAGGDVYFDVSRDDDYGKLCNRDPEQLESGARIEVSDKKRNPGDFALWKAAKPHEPAEVQYDSPWGKGRPGWHIECSVMSQALLGDTIDIHGGGLDLQFPHHENELAQSESDTGKPFARIWMHNGLLKMGGAKMAGSVGNVVNMTDLLRLHDPETIRLLLLGTHYRSPIEYSPQRLDEVAKSLGGFYRYFERFRSITGTDFYDLPERAPAELPPSPLSGPVAELRANYFANLDDDFNTGGAVGVLFEMLAILRKYVADRKLETEAGRDPADVEALRTGTAVLREFGSILGLFWQKPPAEAAPQLAGGGALVDGLMAILLSVREKLRATAKGAAKDNPLKKPLFDATDDIRAELARLNIVLEDQPGGTKWGVVPPAPKAG